MYYSFNKTKEKNIIIIVFCNSYQEAMSPDENLQF